MIFIFNSINAQTNSVEAQLQAFVDNGTVKNGIVVQMQSTNPQLQYAIRQESSKTPGKFRYFFIDRRVGGFENGTFVFYPGQSDVNAQTNSVEAQLQAFVDNGTVKNGIVVQMQSTNPQLQYAIRQESSKTPGKFRYFFIDRRVGGFENGTFVFYPGQSDVYEPSTINAPQNSANKTKSNGNESASLLTANDLDNLLGNFIRDVLSSGSSSGGGNQQSSRSSYNSYQCRRCGFLSNTTNKPLTYAFGGCSKDTSHSGHSWEIANTMHGFQCSRCGVKSYATDSQGNPNKPLTYAFGGCSKDTSHSGHSWKIF